MTQTKIIVIAKPISFRYAGITSVSLANNHIFDRNQEGIHSTVNLLEKYKIKYTGVTPLKVNTANFSHLFYT